MSFGYNFHMSKRPIDFAHWSLLMASLFMLVLWKVFPEYTTKGPELLLMSIGVVGVIDIYTLDILW